MRFIRRTFSGLLWLLATPVWAPFAIPFLAMRNTRLAPQPVRIPSRCA